MQKSFELSSRKYKNGRRKFTAVLYQLQPPECVVNGVGTQYNKNGITFLEKYAEKELESIKGMSVTVSFLDDERTQICDHGFTEMNTKDGLPTFENATMVGAFSKGYIDTIEINGVPTRCVCGQGTLDEMRYHNFVEKLEEDVANGISVEGSIEIYRDENHETIIYENGYRDKGRIPQYYIHSGWSFVMSPADPASTLVELNQKKEDENNMTEKEIMDVVHRAITETNAVKEDMNTTITNLNSQLIEKGNKISELNATVEQLQKALEDLKKEQEASWAERDALEKQLGELKAKERLNELNEAISAFTEDEQKYAESEINSFKENPVDGDVNAIVGKIYSGIGEALKKAEIGAKIAEQNAAKDVIVEDIFSEVNSAENEGNEDVNIF